MAIDDIKLPGAHSPIGAFSEAPVAPQKKTQFAQSQSHSPESITSQVPPAIAGFTRTALDDPAKLNVAIRALASGLVDSEGGAQLPPSAKQPIVDLISQDPLLRTELEAYLRKTLT